MYIIDWEYSGNNDPMWDLSFFAIQANLDANQEKFMLDTYFAGKDYPIELLRYQLYKPIIEYWISLWSHIQIYNENHTAGLDNLVQHEKQHMATCINLFEKSDYLDSLEQLKKITASSDYNNSFKLRT